MKNLNLDLNVFRLGFSTLGSIVVSSLYSIAGIDFSYPTNVYLYVTNACNSKCRMCDVWREPELVEIPARFWIKVLKELKSFNNTVMVSFSGGEALLHKDIFEIFKCCHELNIPFGITTNGILLNEENIRKFIELGPFNLYFSLDSLDSEVYRKIRGTQSLETVKANIDLLMKYKTKVRSNLRIIMKTVVNSLNVDELPRLAEYAKQMNLNGIMFDPIKRRREPFVDTVIDEFEEMFAIDEGRLQQAVGHLIRLKKEGYNILNSEKNMKQWFYYAKMETNTVCKVPLKSLYINRNGDVGLCDFSESKIGNIKLQQDVKSMWYSEEGRKLRAELVRCKKPCVYCVRRSPRDYLELFFAFLKRG